MADWEKREPTLKLYTKLGFNYYSTT